MPEQKERLESFCKFKGYEIVDYYEDAGISAKTGNHRPEFERLKNDIKAKKINTIVAVKLDRITRSIYDWENLMTFLDENNAYLDCVNDEINTTSANGKMISRLLMSVSQNEIERTSERTKIMIPDFKRRRVMDNKLPKIKVDERTGIEYHLEGDYYIPNIAMPKQEKITLNKYGRMRLNYLKEHKKADYTIMLMDRTLNTHLKEIQEIAQTRIDQIINELKQKSDLTEDMKNTDMLYWVGTMNSIKNQAEKIVYKELIYV